MRALTAGLALVGILGGAAFLIIFNSAIRTHTCEAAACSNGFGWAQGIAVFGALAGAFGLFEGRREGGNIDAALAGRIVCPVAYVISALVTVGSI